MTEKQAKFLPFHAINDFMRNDYRLEVVRGTLTKLGDLPEDFSAPIERLTKKLVQVPGFRNSAKAPVHLRVKPTASAFEKSPQLVAAILHAWAESHMELRQQVHDFLKTRNWEILPPEADRTKLPGFFNHFPPKEDFEVLHKAYQEMYPESDANPDDISLMVVWISTRLPYQDDAEKNQEI